ncbi:MAG TPA: PilC/PilY family type IV pilus protein, partial [Candidatus Methylomirabilis sp.]|nr:PilC/PilY family type IV pilus protein [Candidatus Methylomirabilis sp.]
NNTEGVRFGLSKFTGNSSQGPGGGVVLAEIGSSTSTLISQLNGIPPSGYTPLGGALRDIGDYYKSTTNSPIQYECQPNFVIMMSDGLENGTVKLAPQATLRRTEDHSTTLPGTQNVIVHTIGFAVSEDERDAANEVLDEAARNGGGTFYYSSNEAELEAALQDAIRQITAATFMFATPVIPTTSASGAGRAYLASFQSDPSRAFWKGYLKAYNRDANGDVKTNDDGTLDESAGCTVAPDPLHPLTTVPCLAWDAGSILAGTSAGSRTIKTLISGALQTFDTTNVTPTMLGLGSTDTAGRNRIVNFVRGVDTTDEDGDGNTTEDRAWKLGDIFHSTPAVVAPPSQPSLDPSYGTWRNLSAIKGRPTVILAGANDGMLHAFRQSDGVELWAFIPPDLLPRLQSLLVTGGDHPFLMDSSPVVADVKIGGSWKTIVIFGERRGGAYYHALDITDPTSPQYLWSFTDTSSPSKIAETWSEPAIGKVRMDSGTGSTEKYVAIFGGGYDTASNNAHGKALFVVDVSNGTKLWEYYRATGVTDDRQYMNYSLPSNPTAVDLDNDGYIDHVYIGDVGGQMWKFDLSRPAALSGSLVATCTSDSDTNCWRGKLFFSARGTPSSTAPDPGEFYATQAIYYAPSVAFAGAGGERRLWIYFGTGDRNHPLNTTPTANRFYGVKDDPISNMTNGSAITESTSGMVNATSVTTVPDLGWFFVLSSTNKEKVLAASDVFNKMVLWTTFQPSGSAACGASGTSRFYVVQMKTAFAAIDWSTDDKLAYTSSNPSDRTKERGMDLGGGIASEPVITINEKGEQVVSIAYIGLSGDGEGSGGGRLLRPPLPSPTNMRTILYWKENF